MKIHADLKPSHLGRLLEVVLYLLVGVLCALSGLPLWVTLVTAVLLLVVFGTQRLRAAAMPRLIQLIQLDRRDWCWYEVTMSPQHGLQSARVEAKLQQVQRVGPVLVLRFQSAPDNRPCAWVIWRDQVDADNWRRLVVLARFWSDPLPQA